VLRSTVGGINASDLGLSMRQFILWKRDAAYNRAIQNRKCSNMLCSIGCALETACGFQNDHDKEDAEVPMMWIQCMVEGL
jgi:hypothetical protein